MTHPYYVKMTKNEGFYWFRSSSCSAKGHAWYEGHLYRDDSLRALLDGCEDVAALKKMLAQLNGCFAAVLVHDDLLILVSDIVRSIPLYYDVEHRMVSDCPQTICAEKGNSLDDLSIAEELKTALYTCNDRTYFRGIKNVMAGHIVVLDQSSGQADALAYFRHTHEETHGSDTYEAYYPEIEAISDRVFSRTIRLLDGRTAIIPLSGGYDSRYIAVMLKRLGYENVVCYTYGREDSFEVINSRAVAKALGYPHFYVKPDYAKLFDDATCVKYMTYADNRDNLPHIQEVQALKLLAAVAGFPKEGVVLPGFCGDIFGGSYSLSINQRSESEYSRAALVEFIFKKHFNCCTDWNVYDREIKKDIYAFFNLCPTDVSTLAGINSASEEWFALHKIPKYVVNALRPYEFCGYEWAMPLWDLELVRFWYSIPLKWGLPIQQIFDVTVF